MHLLNLKKIYLPIALTLMLSACGGGGASGGTRNLPPTVSNTSPDTIDERTEATLSVSATDPDGSIREYRWLQTGGPRISFSNGRDSITFDVPEVEQNTTLSFSIDVVDDFGAITTLDIGVNIRDVNRAPQADAQQLTVDVNSFVDFNLTATDLDGDTLTYEITVQPLAGSVELLDGTTQQYRYTPTQDSTIDDQLTFTTSDSALSDSAVINFDVVPVTAKSLRITAFANTTLWDEQRWLEISNTGTTSINLEVYEIRTQKLMATEFEANGNYYISLPELILKPGAAKTLLFKVDDLTMNHLITPSPIHSIPLANGSSSRPFWNKSGYIELYDRDQLETIDFVKFGHATQEPLTDSGNITILSLVEQPLGYMRYINKFNSWILQN